MEAREVRKDVNQALVDLAARRAGTRAGERTRQTRGNIQSLVWIYSVRNGVIEWKT